MRGRRPQSLTYEVPPPAVAGDSLPQQRARMAAQSFGEGPQDSAIYSAAANLVVRRIGGRPGRFDGPVRSLRPSFWNTDPISPSPRAPPKAWPLGSG